MSCVRGVVGCAWSVIAAFPSPTHLLFLLIYHRVKAGIFGQTAKFGQRPCLFRISNIGIKNKLTKQTVKILMRRLIRSRLIWIYTVCNRVSEFT